MARFICTTCGVQYPEAATPPHRCPICDEERQYVNPAGQSWTTLADIRRDHAMIVTAEEPGLTSFLPQPKLAIGQRAFLVETPAGNLLWDCVTLMDDATLDLIRDRGGIQAIAISHPHYYATMTHWSELFDCPVYIHAADRQWVQEPSDRVVYWEGTARTILPGIDLICPGGHFDGGTVAHWPAGADGRGVLLAGDILQVVADRRWVSFMYSYPNLIPLPAAAVARIADILRPRRYDRLYGAFAGQKIPSNAHERVEASAARYIHHVTRPI